MLSQLLNVLSKFVHFLETPGCRASFVYPLFAALVQDVSAWCAKKGRRNFESDTIDSIMEELGDRWNPQPKADRRRTKRAGLYSPQYLLAMILDPAFAPKHDALQDNWMEECEKILVRFHPEDKDPEGLLAVKKELENVVLHNQAFGVQAKSQQGSLSMSIGNPPSQANIGHVAHEIEKMKMALKNCDPTNSWELYLRAQFPKLNEIAKRMMQMGTQSADVERVCKAHKVVHSKSRNRLVNKNVNMLLYCYVNMRLIERYRAVGIVAEASVTEKENPKSGEVSYELSDFLEQALLITAEDGDDNDN